MVSSAMAAVEEMEQRAHEEQQVREGAQDMGGMLGHHEERRDPKEREQHHPRA
jgi:hypothetical protein